MAYKANQRSSTFQPTGSRGLNTAQDYARGISSGDFFELESAEVVDVIRDSDHPEFRGFEDIGKIKFRFVYSQKNQPESQLFLARPFHANSKKHPLRHEIVLIGKFMGNYYYTGTINHRLSQNHNEVPNVSIDPALKSGSTSKQQGYRESSAGDTSSSNQDTSLGETFTVNDSFKPLKHDEGDIILEGRFSNSIRFGSNPDSGNPIVKIRCGQYEEASDLEYLEPIYEKINEDPASIWLSEDSVIDFKPSTEDSETHLSSTESPPDEYSGKQLIQVSDRIILNSQKNQIMLFSKGEININTASNITIDADKNVVSNVLGDRTHDTEGNVVSNVTGDRTRDTGGSITSSIGGDLSTTVGGKAEHEISDKVVWDVPEMYFGKEDQSEPVVLGQTLLDLMSQMLNAIQQQTHPSPVGPTGPPINSPQFAQIQQKLQTMLSQQNYTQ